MHADRTNRAALVLLAILLIAAGVLGALLSFGVFGDARQHRSLIDNAVGRYFGAQSQWLWPVIAVAAGLIALLCLRWLFLLLFSTDRVGDVGIRGDRSAGRTTLISTALTDAVTDEIDNYAGVHAARARVIGDASSPRLVITTTLEESADLPELRRRIEAQAIAHARQALDDEHLPVQLDLSVTDRRAKRVS